MTEMIRQQIVETLQNDWQTYADSFYRLSPDAQSEFLARQGYARLADLLAHVAAWWQDGSRVIESLIADPGFVIQEYDVDAFNARSVEASRDQDESVVLASFEAARQRMLQFVSGLSETAWENHYVIKRLQVEVIGHLEEHALPEK